MPTDDHERHAFHLGRYWDALGGGTAEPVGAGPLGDDLDPSLARTIHRLHRLAAAPAPAGSRERVWQQLRATTENGAPTRMSAADATATTPNGRTLVASLPAGRRPVDRVRRSWRVAELATAAVVALAVLAGVLAARLAPSSSDDDPPANAGIAATATLTAAAPGPEACRVAPRTIDDLSALVGAPTPVPGSTPPAGGAAGIIGLIVPTGTVSDGAPVDLEILAGIRATAYELTACANAGDFARVLALYTDRWVRSVFIQNGLVTYAEIQANLTATATPVPIGRRDEVPLIRDEEVRLLPDGRVGVALRDPESDGFTYE